MLMDLEFEAECCCPAAVCFRSKVTGLGLIRVRDVELALLKQDLNFFYS